MGRIIRAMIVGPQGSGKSTQAERLSKSLGIVWISSGNLIRREMASGMEFGHRVRARMDAGQWLSDAEVEQLLFTELDKANENGWILEGYPRRISQAESLNKLFPECMVIELVIDAGDCYKRLVDRRVCPHGHLYHLVTKRPRVEGVCDHDGLPLQQRTDDTPEAIVIRLTEFVKESVPMMLWMTRHDLDIRRIGAWRSIEEVTTNILQEISA